MTAGKTSLRISAVTIACTDLDRSVEFYEQILGAQREPGYGYRCRVAPNHSQGKREHREQLPRTIAAGPATRTDLVVVQRFFPREPAAEL